MYFDSLTRCPVTLVLNGLSVVAKAWVSVLWSITILLPAGGYN